MANRITWNNKPEMLELGEKPGDDRCGEILRGYYDITTEYGISFTVEYSITTWDDGRISCEIYIPEDEDYLTLSKNCHSIETAKADCEYSLVNVLRQFSAACDVDSPKEEKVYCESDLVELLTFMKKQVTAQDILIQKMSNNLAIDPDEYTDDPYKREAIFEIRDLVTKCNTWAEAVKLIEDRLVNR